MEMNMHNPQNVLSETELRHLAAIPYQIISPSSNSPLIGIYQDSMLGTYRFTRPDIKFTPREAMNILMGFSRVDVSKLAGKKSITNFDILSQITPPLTLKTKTKQYDDKVDDYNTSNNVLEIVNGEYKRGQMIASTAKSILGRICNDFGHMACADYIDDLQQVITEYMKSSAYSVGVSDLISDKKTYDEISHVISAKKTEVQQLTDKLHMGVFDNKTGNSNSVEFENQVRSLLNKATDQTGAIAKKSLSANNRFLIMVASGSKGNMVNISQMISCLGQQSVDGKRAPYGFDSRTLPHFSKFDDSPGARGFVENSYISGLTAPELFFHAMGGRMGLIDTAVKSVTWETPIVLIETDGKPIYTEIGRWIDAKLDDEANQEAVRKFDEANMELLNISNVFVPTTDENGVVSWEEITAVTRHDPGNALYEIKTFGGRSVTVTESKSLLVWNKEKQGFYEMLTPEIVVGDCVPVTAELCEPPCPIEKTDMEAVEMAQLFHNGADLQTELVVYSTSFIYAFVGELMKLAKSSKYNIDTMSSVCSCNARNERNANIISMLCNRVGCQTSFDGCVVTFVSEPTNKHNNVVLDPIVQITKIGVEKHPKMYDLTIPKTLNFGLANGLQVRDTSQTGYIQRRLVKGLEDLKVEYDMTVRNNMGKIVQFSYGEDNTDPTRIENQNIPIVNMSVEDIYMHYDIIGLTDGEHDMAHVYTKGAASRLRKQRDDARGYCKKYIDYMLNVRDSLVENVFNYRNEDKVMAPVSFHNLIMNVQGQFGLGSNSTVDITPLEAFQMIDETYETLMMSAFCKPNKLFEVLYYYHLSPKDLLVHKRFNRKALEVLLETVVLNYKKSVINPGEMVGVIAGQSIGEPTTQLTLNSFVYETEILVRNSAGVIKAVQIGDFAKWGIETCRKIDYMADKDTTYAELSEFYEVPSVTEEGQTVWRRIEAVTKHPVINEDGSNTMLKVTTKGNREIIATKAKSFLMLIDGKIQGIDGKNLKVGDYLPVSKKALDFAPQTHLDLRTVLPPSEYIYGTEMEKARSVMNEYHWWMKHANKTFVLPYKRSDSAYCALNGGDKKKASKVRVEYKPGCVYTMTNSICNYEIPEFIEMDYGFGYLLGAYCAEGCMTKHQVSISNNDNEYLKPIEDWCAKHNLTTKIYTHKDKIQEGWTSQDIRIYSTVLVHILKTLCGQLSHNKFISDKIMFSNRECILGFMDAYFGGDGCVCMSKDRVIAISVHSVSHKMLTSVQVMLKNLGVLSKMYKPKKRETNNRGSLNIKQGYTLDIRNDQAIKLGQMLRFTIGYKNERISKLLTQTFKYEYCKDDLLIPNVVDGVLRMEARDGRCRDIEFDKIVSIEEVPNTTPYAYDLTVEDTRNFDCMNGVCALDTFHLAGVASKSNVTRGVPRIEEILRLTKNPDKPSVTAYLRPQDQHDKDKAANYCNMLQHTKLVDVVKSVEICFDPNDHATKIHSDAALIDQFFLFDQMANECNEVYQQQADNTRSKWIIRMEIDAETLLDKNITMDDIHFAINSVHGSEVSCIYSDMNSSNLVFRLRLGSSVFNKGKKKGVAYAEALDQSDEIYMLKNFQDNVLNNIVLRGIKKITNVSPRVVKDMVVKEDGKYVRKEAWVLDTTGSNLLDIFATDFIDYTRTYSNDIREMYNVLGIEAVRNNILSEMVEVMEASDAYVNYHHLSVLADRMAVSKDLVSIHRSGILNDDTGPISKSTYEMHTEMFLDASRHGEFDQMRGVSANVMCGQPGYYGTNAFSLLLDMNSVMDMEERAMDRTSVQDRIEELFGAIGKEDACSAANIRMDNNVKHLAASANVVAACEDDGYEIF